MTRRTLAALGAAALGIAVGDPTELRPTLATRQDATPTVSSGGDSFQSLAQLVPDPYPAASTSASPLFYYADLVGQFAAVGLSVPTDPESQDATPWPQVMNGLALPSDITSNFVAIDWEATFGWSPFQIDQSLWFGEPPEVATLLRGRFDAAAVEAALLNLDYRPVEIPGAVAAFSIEHKDLGLDDPVERILFLSSLRTLAILPDGTFVWGQRPGPARAVAAVAAGAPALLDRTPVASLLAAVEAPLASSMLLPGLALQGVPFDPLDMLDAAQTPDAMDDLATEVAAAEVALRAMPPVGFALLGIDYGGEWENLEGTPIALPIDAPPNRFRFYLQFGNRDDAATAAEVIAERLATGGSQRYEQPWSAIFTSWEVSVVPDRPVVRLVLDPGLARGLWFSLLYSRDLGFLAWS
jgi:hypothetical protein